MQASRFLSEICILENLNPMDIFWKWKKKWRILAYMTQET